MPNYETAIKRRSNRCGRIRNFLLACAFLLPLYEIALAQAPSTDDIAAWFQVKAYQDIVNSEQSIAEMRPKLNSMVLYEYYFGAAHACLGGDHRVTARRYQTDALFLSRKLLWKELEGAITQELKTPCTQTKIVRLDSSSKAHSSYMHVNARGKSGLFFFYPNGSSPLRDMSVVISREPDCQPDNSHVSTGETPFVSLGGLRLFAENYQYSRENLRLIAQDATEFIAFLQQTYGFKLPEQKLDVHIFNDQSELRMTAIEKLCFSGINAGIGGVTDTELGVSLVFANDRAVGGMMHELVHWMVKENMPFLPTWLEEGLASLYETAIRSQGAYIGMPNWRPCNIAAQSCPPGFKKRCPFMPSLREVLATPWDYDAQLKEIDGQNERYREIASSWEDVGINDLNPMVARYYLLRVQELKGVNGLSQLVKRYAGVWQHEEFPTYGELLSFANLGDSSKADRDFAKWLWDIQISGIARDQSPPHAFWKPVLYPLNTSQCPRPVGM